MDNETWTRIPDAPHYYASTCGRIASDLRHPWHILKPAPNRDGYFACALKINGKRKNHRVHRLIAAAFLPPQPSPKHEINHFDGVKANNTPINLVWVTHKQNHRHRIDVLGQIPFGGPRNHGEQHPRHKLTDDIVRSIRLRAAAGESQNALAREFGVSQVCICLIATRKTWKHVL